MSLGHLYNNSFGIKRWPNDKANHTCEKNPITYCMSFKELKVFFDYIYNFLASADIKAFSKAMLIGYMDSCATQAIGKAIGLV